MRVKEVCVLVVLALAAVVYAAPDADVNLVPVSFYETNEMLFNITIDNLFKEEVIEEVRVNTENLEVQGVVNFNGWQSNFSEDSIRWHEGDIENNMIALFQFYAKAGLVDDDTGSDIEIISEGNGETTDIIQVTILNDDTSPNISNNVPSDGGFLREGIADQEVSIDAEDPETGIKNASFSYWDCSANATNVTVYDTELECSNGTCVDNVDLSHHEEGDRLCFEFTVYNNALESSTISGEAGFDGTAPEVELIAPDNGSYGGNNTLFSFNATDNLAPTLECTLVIDGEDIDSAVVDNGDASSANYDMSGVEEGTHSWKVRCSDWVGLEAGSDSRDIIIDNTAPEITLVEPENNSMIGDEVIVNIDVTDNYEVADIDYSISLNSSELPEGENNLAVTAEDAAGNVAVKEFKFTVDRTAPVISIIAPEENATSDVHVDFVFDADDNLDDVLNCSVYVDGVLEVNEDVNSSANISRILPMDNYTWKVECSDDAGNTKVSEERNLIVTDITGPDILSDVVYVARTEDYTFDANITDPSGVADVKLWFGNELDVTEDGDIYFGIIETDVSHALGTYNITIFANDTLGNSNSLVDEFELIQGYNITISLDPASVTEGGDVQVSGIALLDDGGDVPEDSVMLYLVNDTVNASIEDGSYTHTFTAEEAGTYTIRAVVVDSVGYEHSAEAEISVAAPVQQQSSGSDSSSGSSGNDFYCGDGICTTASAVNEDCGNCPEDCGNCPVEEDESEESSGGINITEEKTSPDEPREPSPGVGAASSWFNSSIVSNLWAVLLFALIIGVLFVFSRKKKKDIDWNNYFN
ncbi:hypothetical protein GF336_06300 [Candidatus Woesearchaeota archaeon]|nr:hypothetical protein [Candidatus Woesearchaeota archaeon]